jgi:hypothetical protein
MRVQVQWLRTQLLYYSEQRYAYGHCAISSVFSSTGVVLLLFTIEDHSWHYRISLH